MSTAHVEVSDSNSYYFTNVRDNDMIFRTESNSQQIHFGVNSNASSQMVINSNAINVLGNLNVSRPLAFNGIEISRKSEIGGSVNISTTVQSIPGYTQDNTSNITIAGSNAIRFNIGATSNMMTLTTSNLQMNGDISLTKQVNFTGIQLSRRTLPGEMQNITNTVTSIPGYTQDTSSNITVAGSNTVGITCGGVPVATFNNNSLTLGTATTPYNISAGNLGMFRNRIINGDMRIDQRTGGTAGTAGLTGSYLTYNVQPSSFYTTDRFAISSPNIGALTAKQVVLSSNDVAATSGFTTAIEVGSVPKDGLAVYLPFEGNLTDASGNNVSLTTTGTMQYVTANVIGTNSLYLANETNVTNGTSAANYVRATSFTFPTTQFTVAFWMLALNASGANARILFSTNSGSTALTNSIYVSATPTSTLDCGFFNGTNISKPSYAINTWAHVCFTYSSGSLTYYVDGRLVGTTSGTLAHSGFMLGNSSTSATQAFAGLIDDFRIYNRALSTSEIAALATNVGVPASPSATSWLTRLTFDNTTADAQGGLPAPTVTGSAVYTPVCVMGTASLDLTGNTAGSTATNALTYTSATNYNVPFTLCGWINCSTVSGVFIPFALGNSSAGGTEASQLNIPNGSVIIDVNIAGTGFSITSPFTLQAGRWYHICIVASSSPSSAGYLNMYINGIIVCSRSIPAGTLTQNGNAASFPNQLRVGAQTGTTGLYAFKGFIDDVRVYSRVLSSQEMAGLYASSQYASYSIFQQTIEGNNLSDLAWGTTAAHPITASMWIKNNSSTAQQFSISATNAGSGLIAHIPFESSTTADVLGFLTNQTVSGSAAINTSTFKIGTGALDLTANTINTAPSHRVDYNIPFGIQLPLTISLWLNASALGTTNIPFTLSSGLTSSTVSTGGWSFELSFNASGQIIYGLMVNNTTYSTTASVSTALTTGSWVHVVIVLPLGRNGLLYLNGNQVSITTTVLPSSGVLTNYIYTSAPVSQLRLGGEVSTGAFAYKGYIDDVRIYNRDLTAAQIAQLYQNNAITTTPSTYLTPRSVVYNTPAIPANSWQRVAFTIPGDTASNLWLTDTNAGLTLAVCLGASSLYNTTNVAASSNNTTAVWNSVTDFMGNSAQQYGSSSTHLLSSVANSVYITGVQLEKGLISTPFEFRPLTIETPLCQRYYYRKTNESTFERIGITTPIDTTSALSVLTLPTRLRALPLIAASSVSHFGFGASSIPTGITVNGAETSTTSGQFRFTGTGFVNPGLSQILFVNNVAAGSAWIEFNSEI